MKLRALWMALILVAGCAGPQKAVSVSGDVAAADCATADVQRLITYCASPQAADAARRNAELMSVAVNGDGDVPYSPLPIGDSPTRGPEKAPVTIVMFTDLECPYCQQMHQNLSALMKDAPNDVRLVFKHTPLSFHPNAVPAALAALAAREQGKFWEYVDRVYANQETLDRDALIEHARAVGLDVEQFRNDFGSDVHVGAIETDIGLAGQVGVSGTPTLFVNGIRVVGVYPTNELRALVDQQKKLVERFREAGVAEKDVYWRMVAAQYQPTEAIEYDEPEAAPAPERVVAHIPTDGAPVKGAATADALVTIVEFSDFECPFCAAANEVVDAAMEKYGAETRLAFRHFPLPNHENAGPAALASLAAQEAGKFWEYHDLLFASRDDLSSEALVAHAQELGMEPRAVKKRLDDEKSKARIAADQQMALDAGVQGTPTFFVNGVMMMGIESPEAFDALIAEQLALAKQVREETGLVGEELYKAVVERNKAAKQ